MTNELPIIHGTTCKKVKHIRSDHLHLEDFDGPYDVDGVTYCGRCHRCLDERDLFVAKCHEQLAASEASRKELVEVLNQTFGEYLNEDYSDIPDGKAVGEFTASDLRRAVKALAKPSTQE